MIELDRIYNEDCLVGMQRIPDGTVDAIITDLPYGTTACAWDSVIPFDPLWEQFKRVTKPNAAIVLFSQQPFTSVLIMSNIEMYKYNWIWQKDSGSNFLNAHHQPLKITEDICVFGQWATTESKRGEYLNYNPQMRKGFEPYKCVSGAQRKDTAMVRGVCSAQNGGTLTVSDGSRYPVNIVKFNRDDDRFHPTQKPVDLLRYLVLTYSNVGGGNFGRNNRQWHDRRSLHQGKAPLHRLRNQQGVFRHRLQTYQRRETTTDTVLICTYDKMSDEKRKADNLGAVQSISDGLSLSPTNTTYNVRQGHINFITL